MNQNSNQDTIMEEQNEANEMRPRTFPPGYIFRPSPLEILNFLFKKLTEGLVLQFGLILEFDVYNTDPDQLPYYRFASDRERKGYFLTPGKNRNSRRDTPSGYWNLDEEKIPVYDTEGKIAGFKDNLSFYLHDTETAWKMTEYRCNLDGNNKVEEKCIICVVEFEEEETITWQSQLEEELKEEEDSDDE